MKGYSDVNHSLSDTTLRILNQAKFWGVSPHEIITCWTIDEFFDREEFSVMDTDLRNQAEGGSGEESLEPGEVPYIRKNN